MSVLAQLRERGLCISAMGEALKVEPKTALTDDVRALIRANKAVILRELADDSAPQEVARQEILARLAAHPEVKRTFVTRFEGDLLIVSLAVRGVGTCELSIPADRFNGDSLTDSAALLACLDEPKELK